MCYSGWIKWIGHQGPKNEQCYCFWISHPSVIDIDNRDSLSFFSFFFGSLEFLPLLRTLLQTCTFLAWDEQYQHSALIKSVQDELPAPQHVLWCGFCSTVLKMITVVNLVSPLSLLRASVEKDNRWWVTALSPGLAGFESEGWAARSVSQSSGSTARGDAACEGGTYKKNKKKQRWAWWDTSCLSFVNF